MMNNQVIKQIAVLTAFIVILHNGYKVQCADERKKDLHFSFITALTGGSTSSGGIPIIDFALEQINNDSRLLPDYNLKYTQVLDSKCKSISALESFLQHFDSETEPTYITSMCCGCSSATIPVAEISHHWNVPHISFASSSPTLNNRERFKTFFRTLPCYVYVPPTIATILQHFNWKQLGIITQDESPFNSAANGIEIIFREQGWKLGKGAMITPSMEKIDYKQLLDWEEDYRIIMINTFEVHAYHILCEAYRKYGQRLLDQEIVLIMHGRYMTEWWDTAYKHVNSSCTREQVMMALNKTYAITPESYALMENSSAVSYSGMTPAEFLTKYQNLMKEERYSNYTSLNFFGNAYDAMWVVAYGLDLVDRWAQNGTIISDCDDNKYPGELVRLYNFNHTNRRMGCYMEKAFHEVKITGITGPIRFKPDGARPENVMRLKQHRVMQHGDGYKVTRPAVARVTNEDNYAFGIVQYVSNGSVVFSLNESYNSIWPDGVVPYDGSPQDVIDHTHLAITIIYSLLGIIGLAFVVVALIFNTLFRKKRVVKLGSPNLNFLLIAGATLLYLALFFYGTSAQERSQQLEETILCNFRFWLFSVGNTLCFAVILAKQWRIYYIFSNPTPNKMVIKDWMLVIIVAVIVGLEMIVMTVGTAIPGSRITANATLVNDDRQHNGRNERVFIFVCASTAATVWIAISFGYKALLQLGAIFMAFTTRKVKVKGLNDTKELYTIIYINTVIITMLIVTEFALRSHRDVYVTLYGLAIFAGATLFLGLTFIPKAILLYKDPDGSNVFTEHDSQPNTSHFTVTHNTSQDLLEPVTVQDIQAKIAQLQKQLAHFEQGDDVMKRNGDSIATP
ncbi:gamma-aminobutyric acid type B receptor subunit 2-like [Halichondria panicea]|uniref:gamma-aminobutyric acid type B receptor subunit 2-like n=1 Tax=Halichondria panicea TaxID=6063 RepID=UPI00312B902E